MGPVAAAAPVAWRSLRRRARWFGPDDRPLLGWLTEPASGPGGTGVVVVPPLGYEYWTTHAALRALSERLAAQGCSALRFDLDGTGDSAGGPADPDRLDAWRRSVRSAADLLRDDGATSIVLAGVRAGATLALLEGAATGADRIVAWAPVERGRTFVRELQLLGQTVPGDVADIGDGVSQAGSVFAPAALAQLRGIDVADLTVPPAPEVLVVDRDDRPPSDRLLRRLADLGVAADHVVVGGSGVALDRPTEYADVPDDVVRTVSEWVGRSAPAPRPAARDDGTAAVRVDGVLERVVRLGPDRLVGVRTDPVGAARATVVWCNSGSEPHVGPGRAWVEYARALAADGFASVRLDFSGWGESPDLGHAPGRAYDAHCVDEVGSVVGELRAAGERVVVAGLCAGAWVALRAAADCRPDGVIAINPQLYWQPGDPVEADIATETRVRRAEEIRRYARGRRVGLWSALDAVGARHPAADWLRELAASGIPVLTVFAEGDDGLEFLEDRVGRAWREVRRGGTVSCRVVTGIDHPMHRVWRRPDLVDELRRWLVSVTDDRD